MKKNKIVISILLSSILLLLSTVGVFADSVTPDDCDYNIYIEEFMSQYTYISNLTGEECVWPYYTELAYEHYADDNAETPEYLVFTIYCNGNGDTIYYELNGYYFYGYLGYQYDSRPSYLVFDTDTKEVLWFDEAIDKGFDKYFPFISESGYKSIIRIGDVNQDSTLNIKDATEIQKFIAGIESSFDKYDDMVLGFEEKMFGKWERYLSDFNRDGVRNIKDATAIQKHIAGIE